MRPHSDGDRLVNIESVSLLALLDILLPICVIFMNLSRFSFMMRVSLFIIILDIYDEKAPVFLSIDISLSFRITIIFLFK